MRGVTLCGNADVRVTAFARTPFGRFGGKLSAWDTARLGAAAIDAVMERSAAPIDAAYIGVGMIAAGVLTPARRMVLASALDEETPSLTVDRACCSGMTAIGLGVRELLCGEAETVICGGADSLSNTPRLLERRVHPRPATLEVDDPLLFRAPFGDTAIPTYSGEEALRFDVDREAQDRWALESHHRYFEAEDKGCFDSERIPLRVGEDDVTTDEGPRADTSIEKLRDLKTVYDSPTVTPGNAPGLSDGAAMLLLSDTKAKGGREREASARVLGYAQVAGEKTSGTYTPAVAIQKLLTALNLDLDDLAAIEINEAYAATPLVSTLHLAGRDRDLAEALRARTNVHGGAVAIGHPLGASGARIVMALINVLSRRGGGLGAAAICGGYGQGDAIVVRVD